MFTIDLPLVYFRRKYTGGGNKILSERNLLFCSSCKGKVCTFTRPRQIKSIGETMQNVPRVLGQILSWSKSRLLRGRGDAAGLHQLRGRLFSSAAKEFAVFYYCYYFISDAKAGVFCKILFLAFHQQILPSL